MIAAFQAQAGERRHPAPIPGGGIELDARSRPGPARPAFGVLARQVDYARDLSRPHRRRVRPLVLVDQRYAQRDLIGRREPETGWPPDIGDVSPRRGGRAEGGRRAGDRRRDFHLQCSDVQRDRSYRRTKGHQMRSARSRLISWSATAFGSPPVESQAPAGAGSVHTTSM